MKKITLSFFFLTKCTETSNEKINTESVTKEKSFVNRTSLDSTITPGDNFYNYVNGFWIRDNKIPDDKSAITNFSVLVDENREKLRIILEEAANKKEKVKGSIEQKVGDYYKSGMDTLSIENRGYEPIKQILQRIAAIKNYSELITLLAEDFAKSGSDIIDFSVEPDARNSNVNLAALYQSGITLPEDYYTKNDPTTIKQRKELVNYASKLFILIGNDSATAAKKSADILKLETLLAKSHLSQVELRDPIKNYNKISVTQLQKLSPNINWLVVFSKIGVHIDSLNVAQPTYFSKLSALLASQPINSWKSKIEFDYISSYSSSLSKVFRNASFDFARAFSGQSVQTNRWKTMVKYTDEGLKDLASQLFVSKHFKSDAKKRMDEMINNLQLAFKNRIEKLDWMSDSTRKEALFKLNSIMKKIGYPDKWENFDDVEISPDNFFVNNQNIAIHEFNKMINQLGKPVDKADWNMTPFTVNAYYNPIFNEIVFPAGILQLPFFDVNADDAVNYGAIGVAIGHELIHGFDDQGRQFDANGNMNDWWTSIDAEKFNSKTSKLVKQYNSYTVLDSLHVNGSLTLGENIADLGGLTIAYDAFKLTQQGMGNEKLDGFTPDQRFFLSFAGTFKSKSRSEHSRMLIDVDYHSPEQYRINGSLTNFDPFYTAFNVKENNKMYKKPEDRIRIW